MSKTLKSGLAALSLAILFALPASADTIKLTGIGGNNEAGVYTVPYYLSINSKPSITVMCDDYTHDVVVGETWQGNILTYSQLASVLGETRAGASVANGGLGMTLAQAQTAYKELFWLFAQFEAHPTPSGNQTADDINFAAWAIFDPGVKTGAGWTAGALSWYNQALLATNYNSVNTSNFEIISPTDLKDGAGTSPLQNSSPQEYIATPEPGSLFLLGSGGLLGLGSFIRKKMSA